MKVYTENSVYEFDMADKMVRRVPRTTPSFVNTALRKDNEWVKFLTVHYEVGEPMRMVTEHMDDAKDKITLRTTSPVLKIED